jgi:hypothetical protein
MRGVTRPRTQKLFRLRRLGGSRRNASASAVLIPAPQSCKKIVTRAILDLIPLRDKACWACRVLRIRKVAFPVVLHVRCVMTGVRCTVMEYIYGSWRRFVYIGFAVEGEKTGDGISYASHVKNPNPLKARATTFYDPVHNALDKEAQCAWKEGEGSDWPSVYIQKPFMTL